MTFLPLGTKLQNGNFTVGKVVGQGGFGITYHGSDTQLNRHVAIKEFFPLGCTRIGASVQPQGAFDTTSYGNAKAKFLGEARTLAQFRHSGIVHIYTFFEENKTAYLVMEFLKGQTLSQLVETRGALPEKEAVEIIEKVAAATEKLHKSSVLHRDIKPDNVIVCDDGRVVLIDFGLTKKVEEAVGSSTRQLSSTAAFGSDGFAPPEQYLKSGIVGTYTDVYALGATLYFLLTGKVPPSAIERLAGEELTPPEDFNSDVSHHVNDAVIGAMSLKSNLRLQKSNNLVESLQHSVNSGQTVPSTPCVSAQSSIPQAQKNGTRNQIPATKGSCARCGTTYPKTFNRCICGAWLPWATQEAINRASTFEQAQAELLREQLKDKGMPLVEAIQSGKQQFCRCPVCEFRNFLRDSMQQGDEIFCWRCKRQYKIFEIDLLTD